MNILGIGIPELIFIFIIAMIILGPGNMVKTARQLSAGIKKMLNSDLWRSMVISTKEMRNIQDKILKETGLPESLESLKQSTKVITNPASNQWVNTIQNPQRVNNTTLPSDPLQNPVPPISDDVITNRADVQDQSDDGNN